MQAHFNEKLFCGSVFHRTEFEKKKWVLCCSYNLHGIHNFGRLNSIGKNLGLLLGNYKNIFLMGDFTCDMDNVDLKDFSNLYNLKSLTKVPTCFKNAANPTCTDLMLRNSYRSFQNSSVIDRGLSNFYNMAMKIHFQKQKPNIIGYHDNRNFSEREYKQQIHYQLSLLGNVWEGVSFESFLGTCKETLDKTAPIK